MMKMYLISIDPPIWDIVEIRYKVENESQPTPVDIVNKHHNAQAVSAVLFSLNAKIPVKYGQIL